MKAKVRAVEDLYLKIAVFDPLTNHIAELDSSSGHHGQTVTSIKHQFWLDY